MVLVAIAAFVAVGKIEQRVNLAARRQAPWRHSVAAIGWVALAFLAAALPDTRARLFAKAADPAYQHAYPVDRMTADELAFRIVDRDPKLLIVDVRPAEKFVKDGLPGAVNVLAADLFGRGAAPALSQAKQASSLRRGHRTRGRPRCDPRAPPRLRQRGRPRRWARRFQDHDSRCPGVTHARRRRRGRRPGVSYRCSAANRRADEGARARRGGAEAEEDCWWLRRVGPSMDRASSRAGRTKQLAFAEFVRAHPGYPETSALDDLASPRVLAPRSSRPGLRRLCGQRPLRRVAGSAARRSCW